jgi:hypothetical protein
LHKNLVKSSVKYPERSIFGFWGVGHFGSWQVSAAGFVYHQTRGQSDAAGWKRWLGQTLHHGAESHDGDVPAGLVNGCEREQRPAWRILHHQSPPPGHRVEHAHFVIPECAAAPLMS